MSQSRNTVRIIGGEYRRRLLPFPDAQGLRPTPDRVRETLFNWLGQQLYGKSCLDLFAGSGALGFEAASREARRVVMVEKSRTVAESLKANRLLLSAASIDVAQFDALAYLKVCRERFDVVFVDPPFDSDLLAQVLPMLAQVMSEDGLAYIESRRWPEELPGWEVLKRAKAGQVHYGLLRRVAEPG
ncbi:16S rRNA (guanine(966)-N(2))-methyltransferase RsmD [Chromobacterium sp. IRSSSOUMB001]|uniref:16S rRNA (guanine(966)-N(2))-methyltransferase RsmD n=1 Tax=Chromobacterium sp. IRSSSOUMB001 TaxID=2927123 RepID=UPI0020BD8F7C|nr:16S rRNA (guanine(966)-N(2))-methyltransferase RsmD [Chromobacterium sp. IRSSSOUMB001]